MLWPLYIEYNGYCYIQNEVRKIGRENKLSIIGQVQKSLDSKLAIGEVKNVVDRMMACGNEKVWSNMYIS